MVTAVLYNQCEVIRKNVKRRLLIKRFTVITEKSRVFRSPAPVENVAVFSVGNENRFKTVNGTPRDQTGKRNETATRLVRNDPKRRVVRSRTQRKLRGSSQQND